MNTRSSLILGAAIVLGCLIVTLFSNASSVGQGIGTGKDGRYHVAVGNVNAGGIGQGGQIVVIDSSNGQTWLIRGVDNWTSMGKAPK